MARSDELALVFAKPTVAVQRRFEVCRAYFMEHLTAGAIAERFGLHIGSVQVMARDFAAHPTLDQFFVSNRPGRKTSPKREGISQRVAALRREGNTLGQIRLDLQQDGCEISESYLARILREAGFSRLGKRALPSRPGQRAQDGSEVPAVADVKQLSLESGRQVRTQVAGLFLFVPLLLRAHFPEGVEKAGYPGTQQIPSLQALLALLAPKLLGKRRVSHISDLAADEGAGLFAGLNFLPKTTYATDYSYRTDRAMNERLVDTLVSHLPLGEPPISFNLDFHAIPFRGQKSALENHWVPKSHRGQPAIMAFVAQEETRRVMVYATANLLRKEADNMVVKFADHWKELTGHYPGRMMFDSRATTYAHLHELTQRKVGFITIRRRGAAMIERVRSFPAKQWQHCQVEQAKGNRRNIKYVEETVSLREHEKDLRQIVFEGLGHESPTFVLTNDFPERLSARKVLETYAGRNHVEHSLGEKITFFHLDCLSSEVRLNVDFDLTLTVVAALLYQRFADHLKGFNHATPQTIFRRFINTQGTIEITKQEITVCFEKRTHNPILKEAGFEEPSPPINWLGGRVVRLQFP
jgi:transposase